MNGSLVRYLLMLSLCLVVGSGDAQTRGSRLLSPPLSDLNGRRLALTVPAGWKIVRRDAPFHWSTRSYEFEVEATHLKTTLAVTLFWRSPDEARMKGEAEGEPFQTVSGSQGRIHYDEASAGGFNWFLALPVDKTSMVLVLAVNSDTGKAREQQSFVRALYRSVRFIRSTRKSSNHPKSCSANHNLKQTILTRR